MKKFVDQMVIRDPELMMDIAHALETDTASGCKYEIEYREVDGYDPVAKSDRHFTAFEVKIFRVEKMM